MCIRDSKNITILDNCLVYAIDKVLNGFYVSVVKDGESKTYGCNFA